jgi:hypothetical protein
MSDFAELKAVIERARAGKIAVLKVPFALFVKGRPRYPVVKVMCADREKLLVWGYFREIPSAWLHISRSGMPHFDLWGRPAKRVLKEEEALEEFFGKDGFNRT